MAHVNFNKLFLVELQILINGLFIANWKKDSALGKESKEELSECGNPIFSYL